MQASSARAHAPKVAREIRPAARTLVFEKSIRRFDTHGSASFVLQDIERHVPLVFGAQGEKALSRLQRLVRNYANNEPWPYLVASLSTGIPHDELNAFFQREIGNSGPVIIDPDATSKKPRVYESETKAAEDKDDLASTAERTNGLLVILYGIDNPSPEVQYHIQQNQLQRIDSTLTQMLEKDARLRSVRDIINMDEDLKRRLWREGRSLQDAQQRITGLTQNDLQTDSHGEKLRTLAVMIAMHGADTLSDDDMQRIAMSVGMTPERMAEMGLVTPGSSTPSSLPGQDIASREAEASVRWQEQHAFARSRAALSAREDRANRLAHIYQDEDERLQAMEAQARTPQERAFYRRQRANLEEQSRTGMENEAQIQIRERRNIHREERANIETEGTAEGRYSSLATNENVAALDHEQRRQFELQDWNKEERQERMEDVNAIHYRSAIAEAERTGAAPPPPPAGQTRMTAEPTATQQSGAAQPPSAQQPAAANNVYENRAPSEQAVASTRAQQAVRQEPVQPYSTQQETPSAPPQQAETATASPPAQQHAQENSPPSQQASSEPPPGTPLSQEEQARQQDVPQAVLYGQTDQAQPLRTNDAPLSQAEQTERDDQFGRPLDARGTQTPEARLRREERLQPDEQRFPQTGEDRQAAEENQRPFRQGELDTPERRAEVERQAAEKNAEIEADVNRQRELAAQEADQRRIDRAAYDDQQQQDRMEQQQQMAATEREEREAEQNLNQTTTPAGEMADNEVVETPRQEVSNAQRVSQMEQDRRRLNAGPQPEIPPEEPPRPEPKA